MTATANGQVDYSPNDFHRAKAIIEDAASQQQRGPPERMRRVRQMGDTTVVGRGEGNWLDWFCPPQQITEHRDPYSFYWQLDRLKRAEQEVPRPVPPADYVLEEEEEEAPEEWPPAEEGHQEFLSPDSGVHLERDREEETYARPIKAEGQNQNEFLFYCLCPPIQTPPAFRTIGTWTPPPESQPRPSQKDRWSVLDFNFIF